MPLLPPSATYYGGDIVNDNYFLRKGQVIPSGTVLTSQVPILAADGSTQASITVNGNSVPSYKGSITLNSGANDSGTSQVILNGRTTGPNTMNLEVGDNDQINNLFIAGADGVSQVFDEKYNPVDAITGTPQVQTITPVGFSPNATNIRPLFYDTTTNKIVVSNTSLIRFFEVATPEPTGETVVITDPNGNTYSDPEWICCVAGFANGSGDRTYNCLTIQTAGSPWQVRYDSATTSGANYVNILAIHRSLLTGG
jgi:hypothetical protein